MSYYVGGPILTLAPMAAVVAAIYLYRRRQRAKNRRNPLKYALLNAPGASLRAKLKEDEDDLTSLLLAAAIVGFYFGGFVVGRSAPPGIATNLVLAAAWLIATSYLVYRVVSVFGRVQLRRLGLDGEMAAGEALNQLMLDGYRVYHDIPGANYNVDHVIVGPNGVFAVETKTHPKPASGHEAIFDGRVISYPDGKDFKAVVQAQRNAKSLADFLSGAIGRSIRVHPIVVLPGWCVKLTGKPDGCNVLASGQVRAWLPKIAGNRLESTDIVAVTHQLERLCRQEKPLLLCTSDAARYEQKIAI